MVHIQRVTNPAVVALRDRVHIRVDESFPPVLFPARVKITLKGGTIYERYDDSALTRECPTRRSATSS